MQAIHSVYGHCTIDETEWDTSHPFIKATFNNAIQLPRQGEVRTLSVSKSTLTTIRKSKEYVRKHRDKTLVERFIPLCRGIVSDMCTSMDDYEELLQEGYYGLVKASKGYQGDIGSFQAFATPTIKGTILDYWKKRAKIEYTTKVGENFWENMPEPNDHDMTQKEMIDKIKGVLPDLTIRQADLLNVMFLTVAPLTVQEVAYNYNISVKAVYRLRDKTVEKVKELVL
jgi:RNA polymerase sigma factor (sigma-70 family)